MDLERYSYFPLDSLPISGSVVDPYSRGYVYIVGMPSPGIVKIGSAVSMPCRLVQLQVGNPFKLNVEYAVSIYDRDPMQVEFATHRLLSKNRMLGEWFAVSAEEALHAVIKAARNMKAKFGACADAYDAQRAMDVDVREVREEERRRSLRRKLGMEEDA